MSIFTKIIAGEIPCYKILENENFIAFLDVFPVAKGHVLVVPKIEVDKFYDLEADILAEWLVFAQPIALALENAFPCKRVGMSVIGLEVPHAHLHLVPINQIDDLNFAKPKLQYSEDEMRAIQAQILEQLSA